MRQLKFRIWDRQTKQFVHNSAGTHCASRWLIDAFTGRPVDFVVGFEDPEFGSLSDGEDYYVDGTKVVKEPRYVVQQWTGLLDRNGADVYEGDIVKWVVVPLWMRYDFEFEEWENNGKQMQDLIRLVEWKYNSFHCFSANAFIPYNAEECEIIGNKFENPELLK